MWFTLIKDIIKNPQIITLGVLHRTARFIVDDGLYLRIRYRIMMKKRLNLKAPSTFNEKLQWLKLYDRNPLYTLMVDKYEVKKYVASMIGEEYVVPCFGVWNRVSDINLSELPNQFVLKTTHDSSGVVVCRDKQNFNLQRETMGLVQSLNISLYNLTREWPYRDVKHRIIADMYLDDGRPGELFDYKFWCFNGIPKIMYITNKGKHIYENFYDMDFNVVNINHGFPRYNPEYEKPRNFELMKALAMDLSAGIPFVRIDFFDVNGRVYFGEFTFYDWAGFRPFSLDKMDEQLGSYIELPTIR